jgi:hypothetical protein
MMNKNIMENFKDLKSELISQETIFVRHLGKT